MVIDPATAPSTAAAAISGTTNLNDARQRSFYTRPGREDLHRFWNAERSHHLGSGRGGRSSGLNRPAHRQLSAKIRRSLLTRRARQGSLDESFNDTLVTPDPHAPGFFGILLPG